MKAKHFAAVILTSLLVATVLGSVTVFGVTKKEKLLNEPIQFSFSGSVGYDYEKTFDVFQVPEDKMLAIEFITAKVSYLPYAVIPFPGADTYSDSMDCEVITTLNDVQVAYGLGVLEPLGRRILSSKDNSLPIPNSQFLAEMVKIYANPGTTVSGSPSTNERDCSLER